MMGLMDKKKGSGLAMLLLAKKKPGSDDASGPSPFRPSGAAPEEGDVSQKAAALAAMRAFISASQGSDVEAALRAFVELKDATDGLDLDEGASEDEASEAPGTDSTSTFG